MPWKRNASPQGKKGVRLKALQLPLDEGGSPQCDQNSELSAATFATAWYDSHGQLDQLETSGAGETSFVVTDFQCEVTPCDPPVAGRRSWKLTKTRRQIRLPPGSIRVSRWSVSINCDPCCVAVASSSSSSSSSSSAASSSSYSSSVACPKAESAAESCPQGFFKCNCCGTFQGYPITCITRTLKAQLKIGTCYVSDIETEQGTGCQWEWTFKNVPDCRTEPATTRDVKGKLYCTLGQPGPPALWLLELDDPSDLCTPETGGTACGPCLPTRATCCPASFVFSECGGFDFVCVTGAVCGGGEWRVEITE